MEIEFTLEFNKWLRELKDRRAIQYIAQRFVRFQDENFGDYKIFSGGLYEFRIHYGPGYRLYGVKKAQTIILLLCGGNKSSQQKDIDHAYKLMREYLND